MIGVPDGELYIYSLAAPRSVLEVSNTVASGFVSRSNLLCNDEEHAGRFLSVSFMTREGDDKWSATFTIHALFPNHHSSSLYHQGR